MPPTTTAAKHVSGYGSSHSGTRHFYHQRLSGIALVPLMLFVIFTFVFYGRGSHADMAAWLGYPPVTTLMILTLACIATHARLGMQTIIEDYIHSESLKIVALITSVFGIILLTATGIIALLKLCLSG